MSTRFDRTAALIGDDGISKLKSAHIIVVGLGGVGGVAAECLARSGVGSLTLVDGDVFEPTNLNRQLLCTARSLGMSKASVAAERMREVAPDIEARAVSEFLTADNVNALLDGVGYCVDAIDDIANKVELIKACKARGIPVISAMGAGNRLDCDFRVCDIYATQCDPFARVMRKRLKAEGVAELETVCAVTPPVTTRSGAPASIASPPLVMGAMLAARVVQRIVGV